MSYRKFMPSIAKPVFGSIPIRRFEFALKLDFMLYWQEPQSGILLKLRGIRYARHTDRYLASVLQDGRLRSLDMERNDQVIACDVEVDGQKLTTLGTTAEAA